MTSGIESISSSVSLNTVKANTAAVPQVDTSSDFVEDVNKLLNIKQRSDKENVATTVTKKVSEAENRIKDITV